MVCIEMLRWGTAPGSKKLAQRPGLGSAAGRWTVEGGGEGRPGSGGRWQQLLTGAVLMLCALSALAGYN